MKFKSKQYLAFIALVQFLGVSAEAQYEASPIPTYSVTPMPSYEPSPIPTYVVTPMPSYEPSVYPTYEATPMPSYEPSSYPTYEPSLVDTTEPSPLPTYIFTVAPSPEPTVVATEPAAPDCRTIFPDPREFGEGTFESPLYSEWYSADGRTKTIFTGKDRETNQTTNINGTVTAIRGSESHWTYEEWFCEEKFDSFGNPTGRWDWVREQRIVHDDQNESVIKVTEATNTYKSNYFIEISEQTTPRGATAQDIIYDYYKFRDGLDRQKYGDNGDKDEDTWKYTIKSNTNNINDRKENGHMLKTQTRNGNCIGVRTDRVDGQDQAPYNVQCPMPMPMPQ